MAARCCRLRRQLTAAGRERAPIEGPVTLSFTRQEYLIRSLRRRTEREARHVQVSDHRAVAIIVDSRGVLEIATLDDRDVERGFPGLVLQHASVLPLLTESGNHRHGNEQDLIARVGLGVIHRETDAMERLEIDAIFVFANRFGLEESIAQCALGDDPIGDRICLVLVRESGPSARGPDACTKLQLVDGGYEVPWLLRHAPGDRSSAERLPPIRPTEE